jgi:hypothetical protein
MSISRKMCLIGIMVKGGEHLAPGDDRDVRTSFSSSLRVKGSSLEMSRLIVIMKGVRRSLLSPSPGIVCVYSHTQPGCPLTFPLTNN